MKVLVTGATSLLGRTVAQQLIDRGESVTVFQRGPSQLACREVQGDITNRDAVHVAAAGCEAVIHLAARVVPTGARSLFEQVNVNGSRNVLAAAQSHGLRRLVYVSSPSVSQPAGAQAGVGAATADPNTAQTHYASTKAEAELELLAAATSELSVVAVRPHLVWGPGDTQLIGRIVERARSGQLRIVGTGAALVDTTYVTNAADAIVAALDRANQVSGNAYVVSNGEPRPMAELLSSICRAAGVQEPTRAIGAGVAKFLGAGIEAAWTALRLSQDPPMTRFLADQLSTAHWYDQRETRRALDWSPAVSLDEGFCHLAEWYDR